MPSCSFATKAGRAGPAGDRHPQRLRATLTVGGRIGLWEDLLLRWLPIFAQLAPDIAVRSLIGFEEDLMQALIDGRADVGVMYTPQSFLLHGNCYLRQIAANHVLRRGQQLSGIILRFPRRERPQAKLGSAWSVGESPLVTSCASPRAPARRAARRPDRSQTVHPSRAAEPLAFGRQPPHPVTPQGGGSHCRHRHSESGPAHEQQAKSS